MDLAGKYFSPRPSPIVKRFEFNSRRQKEGESIATYVAELRKIAEHCDFGAVLSDMLRDRLVCGTVHKGIQRRLLVETALTFDKALEISLAAEAADKDSLRLTGGTSKGDLATAEVEGPPATAVHKLGPPTRQTPDNSGKSSGFSPTNKSGCTGVVGTTQLPLAPARSSPVTSARRRAIWLKCAARSSRTVESSGLMW